MSKPIVLKTYTDDSKFPYFFQSELIEENSIFIVQRCQSIPHALFVLDVWNNEKYNIGEVDRWVDPKKEAYIKYLYNDNTDIRKVEVNGGDNDMKVLIYKKEGKVHTCALLKFK